MADLDTLILMFQTQLSDVMETVLKTAMHEVTRLVKNGFVEEVRRRNQDVETLRTQLQWAETKLSEADEVETGRQNVRCVDCGKAVCSEGTSDAAEESGTELEYGVLMGCGMKQEDDAMELCTRSHGQEVVSELAQEQEADVPVLILSPLRESVTTEQDDVRPVVDVKKEEVNEPSCSAEPSGDWAVGHDGAGVGSESHSMSEWTEAQPEQTQQSSEELLRTIMRQDPQTPIAHTCTDQEETRSLYACMVTEPSEISPFEIDSTQVTSTLRPTGLPLSHTHEMGNNCETAMTRVTPKQMGHNATAPISARVGRDHISSSDSPRARQHFSDMGTVVIKEEIIVNSDEGEEMEETEMMRPGMAPSFTVNQYMGGPEVHKQNKISHKPTVTEVMKLHSKVGSSTMLKATVQHHQTIKKPTHSLASNTSRTASSDVHSQVASLNLHHRTPATSKGVPPLLSLQRAQEPKRPLTLTRTSSIPWVSIKTHQQSANSQHLHTHSGSHSHSHLLRCSQCGKCFPHPSNLKAHLQTHTGERPFCCSLCGRSFTKLSNLKAHRRVHTGERPYCCLACGKRFTQKCNLKRHQRIHLE